MESRILLDAVADAGQWDLAAMIELDGQGQASVNGAIDSVTDTDLFRFTASVSGIAMITTTPVGGSLTPYTAIFDSRPTFVAEGPGGSVASADVVAGTTYYALIGNGIEPGSTGAYTLDIDTVVRSPDDHANSGEWGAATDVPLDISSGAGSASGTIDSESDTDLFTFTAISDGMLLEVIPEGDLDAYIYIYDHNPTLLSGDPVGDGLVMPFSMLVLPLTQGQAYYIAITGDGSLGEYELAFTSTGAPAADDHADVGQWSSATPISLNSEGDGSATGIIDGRWDYDLFTFTAAGSGSTRIDVTTPASGLDPVVILYDSAPTVIWFDDDSGDEFDARLDVEVAADQTYYVVVLSAIEDSSGSYEVHLDGPAGAPSPTDDHADRGEWPSASTISISSTTGDGSRTGTIETAGDTDLFKFSVPVSGPAFLRLEVSAGFDGVMEFFDHDFRPVGPPIDQNGAGVGESTATVLTQARTYYLLVSGAEGEAATGAYSIHVNASDRGGGPTSISDNPPDLALLEDADNPVVRLETDLGRIDIEVLMNEAPIAGGNFLQMLRSGASDLSFFHSLTPGQTLGGGLFKLVDGAPTALSQEFDIELATPRPNTERTLAAPHLGGGLDTTDGRWIFNLSDDPGRDAQFVVFARVIEGWSVVQSIASLMTANFSAAAPPLTAVPVISGGPLSEQVTVDIIDADQIKPQGVRQYWTQSVVYPEGFAGPEKREILSIAATTDFDIRYEVTIRYETGQRRDVVVAFGELAGNDRLELVLSDPGDLLADRVTGGVPYAVEVRAVGVATMTAPPADVVSATIDRTEGFFRFEDLLTPDSGAPSSRENFFNLAGHTNLELRDWVLGPVEGTDSFTLSDGTLRLITRQSFVTWMNLTAQAATVTITFLGGGEALSYDFTLDPLRRGGAAVHEELFEREGITTFLEGVRVTSTQPIAVQFSGYAQILDDPPTGANRQFRSAYNSLGLPGGGYTTGVMPTIGETVYVNPGSTPVDITVEAINVDGLIDVFELNNVQPGELAFGPELAELTIDAQAIRYTATGRVGAFLFGEGDGFNVTTPFQHTIGNALHFAGAAPGAIGEDWQLGIYRPELDDPATRFRVRFTFDDGTQVNTSVLNFNDSGFRSLRLDDTELLPVRASFLGGDRSFSVHVFSVESGGTSRAGGQLGAILLSETAGADDGWAMIGMPTGPIAPWSPGTGG